MLGAMVMPLWRVIANMWHATVTWCSARPFLDMTLCSMVTASVAPQSATCPVVNTAQVYHLQLAMPHGQVGWGRAPHAGARAPSVPRARTSADRAWMPWGAARHDLPGWAMWSVLQGTCGVTQRPRRRIWAAWRAMSSRMSASISVPTPPHPMRSARPTHQSVQGEV